MNAFVGLAEKYTKTVPIADIHQDIIREVIFSRLEGQGILPRLWYFPDAARGLFFIKSDGCGEAGIDKEIELAEAHDAQVTFYRAAKSAYPGEMIREWRDRGHGMSIEVNINEVTYGRMLAEFDAERYEAIRAIISRHAHAFREECGFECGSTCIHSCQWTGAPMAKILLEHGWRLRTHFVSHDPRMRKETFGPYTISSTLPMRYYDYYEGLMDIFMQPAQYDESQAVGEGAVPPGKPEAGMVQRVGFTQDEYSKALERFMKESVEKYHGVHIANFHPAYLDPSHPRTSFDSFCAVLDAAKRLGMPRWNLESWAAFVRGRSCLRINRVEEKNDRTIVEMTCDYDVDGLTIMLEGASSLTGAFLESGTLAIKKGVFEGKEQYYVVLSLQAGKKTAIHLVEGHS